MHIMYIPLLVVFKMKSTTHATTSGNTELFTVQIKHFMEKLHSNISQNFFTTNK